jgi:hypothetical protein
MFEALGQRQLHGGSVENKKESKIAGRKWTQEEAARYRRYCQTVSRGREGVERPLPPPVLLWWRRALVAVGGRR